MTVTNATSLLLLFQSKIEEAVNLVPKMCPEEKLKAVQFWNIVSEKLQDIVNNSAADINAVALKMGVEDSEKINLEIENSASSNISPDFMHLPSNYAICSETDSQYNNTIINNTELIASGSQFSTNTEDNADVTTEPHVQYLRTSVDCHGHISKPNSHDLSNQFLNIENLHSDNCNTFIVNSSSSEISKDLVSVPNIKNSDSQLDTRDSLTVDEKCSLSGPKKKPKTRSGVKNNENCSKNSVKSLRVGKNIRASKKKGNKFSLLKHLVLQNKKCDESKNNLKSENKEPVISNVSENLKDSCSGDKSDFDSLSALDESNESGSTERIVSFVVSNTEEILAKGEIQPHQPCAENAVINSEKPFICKVCDKVLPDSSSLTTHSWVHTKPYSCTDCQAQFSTKGNLIVHMRKHTGEKPYCCSKCSSRFSTKGNLKRHLKTHSGEKPWQCNRCGGRFTEKKSLNVHMRRHTGEKPYQCKMCGKKFAQTGVLQTHMAMHLDQKVHLCERCGKAFRQKSQLRLHKLRHDNIRKYNCVNCPANFLTKGDLERHARTHTGERPFVCDVCSRTFTRQQSLNEHMNRHYGLKPYECKYCGKTFAEMSACYKHIKSHEKTGDISKADPITQEPKSHSVQLCPTENSDGKLQNADSNSKILTTILNTNNAGCELGNERSHSVAVFCCLQ
ncbi:zinc finger protein 37 homolog [Stegodyphus dumicola]|uniref:zinc finger protein 37 homolog n=1 Tax=Stegodyphus dumicola TaxID=202533 RepID=UPI0015B22CC8|nr:zinc finger protein 37 homolog [Stegodyphus dumicola]